MINEELSYCIAELNQVYEDYFIAYSSHKNGRNKAIRDNATNKMDSAKNVAKKLFDSYPELWERVEYPEEFFSYQYFLRDLLKLISTLKSEQRNQ